MNWLLIAGIALVVAGLLVFWWRHRTQRDLASMSIETSPAAEVARLAPGSPVEVKGTVRCASPLEGEFSKMSCVYYASEITHTYEEDYQDNEGRWQTRTQTSSVYSDKQDVPFEVEDASGTVTVHPAGARFEAASVIDQYAPSTGGGASISFGSFRLNTGDRSQGHRYLESVLHVGEPVYVLGVVQADGTIGAPARGQGGTLVISHQSEEERTAGLGSKAAWLTWSAVALLVLGAALALFGLVRG